MGIVTCCKPVEFLAITPTYAGGELDRSAGMLEAGMLKHASATEACARQRNCSYICRVTQEKISLGLLYVGVTHKTQFHVVLPWLAVNHECHALCLSKLGNFGPLLQQVPNTLAVDNSRYRY